MDPVVSVEEITRFDSELMRRGSIAQVIDRVGYALAQVAVGLLGGTYGRRVTIIVGRGNNGEDGRSMGRHLERIGVRVSVVEFGALTSLSVAPRADLIVDAMVGTGLRRPFEPPKLSDDVPVLSIDIPSGISGDSGEVMGEAVRADYTVAVGALKLGHVFGAGPAHAGRLIRILPELRPANVQAHLITFRDLDAVVPAVPSQSHKWSAGVMVVGGSPGMRGSAAFGCAAAMAVGAGIVHLVTRAEPTEPVAHPQEVVVDRVESYFAEPVVTASRRFRSMVVGPGLGGSLQIGNFVRRLLIDSDCPVVLDADGINCFRDAGNLARTLSRRRASTVLTPHRGEFERVFGTIDGSPVEACRRAADESGAVVLLKGSPTIVADPRGSVALIAAGSAKLASAGTGDVLAGVIAGFLAQGMSAYEAAWAGAYLHGAAGASVSTGKVTATSLIEAIAHYYGGLDRVMPPQDLLR
ncbi:MAG: NAD(P)H-hydrate dehydratase [Ferrimicrobium sp.]|uniref:ADP-dependent (S)-NAD(P)H-hydrate dehydratase n=2 Tax=Ferrimicrobium TaxID=121038 RepID=A0ABV3XYW0_9ACTN|nr:NAD(P)H-hydrate dehydratase [Ferrimicrobium sp.]MCL5973284.1 NAD(P)H-hydrate dehydratase [Actinomycetota bacterium]